MIDSEGSLMLFSGTIETREIRVGSKVDGESHGFRKRTG
jgi:hypothetical protein